MNRLFRPHDKTSQYFIVILMIAIYLWVFAFFHHDYGMILSALAILPVIFGSWYFGVSGGIVTAILSIVADIGALLALGHPLGELFVGTAYFIGNALIFLIALIVGRMATLLGERNDALLSLKIIEEERRNYLELLESLIETTRIFLEADNLESALQVLVENIGKFFKADDCFFAFWDDASRVTTPVVAYGPMREIFPKLVFEPGERTLIAVVMEAGGPLVIEDLKTTSLWEPGIASLFSNRSILGIPLTIEGNNLASLILGYNQKREFAPQEIAYAEIAAQQIAMILTKLQLLQNAQIRVKQLTVLHEVAIISTDADTLDQLIERITEVIGKNLFPDNFGILLMDHEKNVLKPHPSYRFVARVNRLVPDVPLGEGVSGQVAQTGVPVRLGNIRELDNYLDIDPSTISELCVPIKVKDQILGVINTESSRPNAFTPDDELLLGTLAGQLATGIEQLRAKEGERKWLDQLAHSNDLIYSMAQITTQINKSLTTDEIIQNLGSELEKIRLTCIMAIHDVNRNTFTINYTSLKSHFLEIVETGLGYPLVEYTFSRDTLEQVLSKKDIFHPAAIAKPEEEILVLFTDAEREGVKRILQEIGVTSEIRPLRLPLTFEENLLGLLWIWGGGLQKSDLPILSIFAKQIGISLERARLFKEVQELAFTDPLTGLNNRRSLFELGKIEFSRAVRMKRSFCCMMLDLDHFKQVNDNYGHLTGDQVLEEFAKRCKASIREVDLIGRYGGEELIILLPETDLKTAKQIAERLCEYISETPMKFSTNEINVTVSIGIAQKDKNTSDLKTLIARADQAMYVAKHKGRNRVAVSV
jgi:diguanylate cyclase (GGDEF)-like protein